MERQAGSSLVEAGFAQERDAHTAMRMIASMTDARIAYSIRQVLDQQGGVALVVLEAVFDDLDLAERLLTVLRGAHGVPMRVETTPVSRPADPIPADPIAQAG